MPPISRASRGWPSVCEESTRQLRIADLGRPSSDPSQGGNARSDSAREARILISFAFRRLTFAADRRNWKTYLAHAYPPISPGRRSIVTDTPKRGPTRRDVMKTTGKVAAASALAGLAIPHVHAGENNTIQVGPGRLRRPRHRRRRGRPVQQERPHQARRHGRRFPRSAQGQLRQPQAQLETTSRSTCPKTASSSASTPTNRPWTVCKPGDVVILTTPPAFRWVHFTYAIQKGLNVFMEKPITVDGPTTRRMLKLGEEAKSQEPQGRRRPDVPALPSRSELFKRIKDGEIGDITLLRAYRQHGPVALLRLAAQAGRHQRAALSDPALPLVLVGQRRLLQRFLHPQHRRMLLDEERLAGRGPGVGRPALSQHAAAPTSIRTSITTPSNTPSPTAPS